MPPHRQVHKLYVLRPACMSHSMSIFWFGSPLTRRSITSSTCPSTGTLTTAFVFIELRGRQIALMISTDLSMTITAAVPKPGPNHHVVIKSMIASRMFTHAHRVPMIHLDRPTIIPSPRMPPQWFRSTLQTDRHCLFHDAGWFRVSPVNNLVPALFWRPNPANHSVHGKKLLAQQMIQRCSGCGKTIKPAPAGKVSSRHALYLHLINRFLHRKYAPAPWCNKVKIPA